MTTSGPVTASLKFADLKLARLRVRYKRFFCDCVLETGEDITAHCPNPGKMLGVLHADAPVLLTHLPDPTRKLAYRLEAIKSRDVWIGVNTQWPNRFIHDALTHDRIEGLRGFSHIRPEVAYGHGSRVDFCLEGHAECPTTFVEVKNVHFSRVTGLAEFPDSVTARGTKHLIELKAEIRKGHRCVVIFCIQRADVTRFDVAADLDPAFARAYLAARAAGLEVMALSWGWTETGPSFSHVVEML